MDMHTVAVYVKIMHMRHILDDTVDLEACSSFYHVSHFYEDRLLLYSLLKLWLGTT